MRRSGTRVISSAARRSGAPMSTGRSSDEAAAAITAPIAASRYRVLVRSPRKACQIASAASRAPGSSTRVSRIARTALSATTPTTPQITIATPICITVRRRSGEIEQRGAGEDQRQHQQEPGERLDVAGELGGVGEPRRGVDLGDLDVDATRHLLRELRAQGLDRAAEHLADVRERQRGRVRVAAEDRAVHVADPAAEQALEDAAADDPVDDALDQRPGADQVPLGVEHEVVGDPARDLGADRLVVERRRRPLGELVGVEEGVVGVAGDHRPQQGERREDRQAGCRDPSRSLAHGRSLPMPTVGSRPRR